MAEHQFKGRREDARLLTGRGRYTSDHALPDQAAAYFLRADRAHANIARIDVAQAREQPGVIDILTGEDVAATGWKGPAAMAFFKGVGGSSLRVPFRSALAHQKVRYVGEPVVLVVAETEHQAQDAAELIEIAYDDLRALVEAKDALEPGAPPLHPDWSDNLAFDYEYGNSASTEPGFTQAAHVARVSLRAQRIAGNPMEPKSCTARYDAAADSYEVFIPTQGISDIKTSLSQITGLAPEKFTIRSMDVGGAFGVRNEVYPEFLAVLLAAKRTGRPVRWLGTRAETISGDHHARAADLTGELALDADGRFLALRVEWLVNLGAYCSNAGPLINTVAAPTSSAMSLYNVPALYGHHRLVFTNTTPVTAYRGAGRPNVAYLWERLVERAAAVTGIDAVKLRKRNLLRKNAFPLKTPTNSTYDSADPPRLLDAALKASEWAGFGKRRRASKKDGKLRGIGLAMFIEPSGGMGKEQVELRIAPDGKVLMFSNAGPSGQGHETVFPAVVAEILGVPDERVELRPNDNAVARFAGTGSFGSRSLISHGAALATGAKQIIEKGLKLAATQLEASPSDIVFENGRYRVAGTDVSLAMETLLDKVRADASRPLDTNTSIDLANAFPSGAHVAEVEIDPATGASRIVNYTAADDCGRIVNHTLVEGQLLGGMMQGIGQVFGEHIVYDPATGQLLSGTFMDYAMPHADDVGPVTMIDCGVPSPANVLGAKGAGEAGATGAVPALANAVLDALREAGVTHLEMPYSPARVWAAIAEAGRKGPASGV